MDTKKLNLFVFDSKENFDKSKEFLGEENSTFKRMYCVNNMSQLDQYIDTLGDDEYLFLVVHVFYTDKLAGIIKYKNSGIREKYPALGEMFISDGDDKEIKHKFVDARLPQNEVYKYHEVYSKLQTDAFKVFTKRDMLKESSKQIAAALPDVEFQNTLFYPQIDYGIITALYEDEFEELKKVFDFYDNDRIVTATKVYHVGTLKSNTNKRVVAAIPNATGMVDASIVATQLLEFFRPKYLLMSGVCGGATSYSYGDIIIAKQVYTFQKGKLSDITVKDNDGKETKVDLYDSNHNIVDYTKLFDHEGNQISISIEKFSIEHDAIISINPFLEDTLRPVLKALEHKINHAIHENNFFSNRKEIKVDIEPIACSTMVINKENYFDDVIKSVNRKTAAVEMESYGVARACQFANGGRTSFLIFKSVMDNTHNKVDGVEGVNVKKFAAYTSAQFMRFIFEDNII